MRNLIYIILISIIFISACNLHPEATVKSSQNSADSNSISVQTFKTGGGWGYNILIGTKAYIRQEIIPAIQGNRPFKTESDAKKVGEWMVVQLQKQRRVGISPDELEKMGIIIGEH